MVGVSNSDLANFSLTVLPSDFLGGQKARIFTAITENIRIGRAESGANSAIIGQNFRIFDCRIRYDSGIVNDCACSSRPCVPSLFCQM